MDDRRIGQTGCEPGRAEVKSKSTDKSKSSCVFAPGAFKCDLSALLEVSLNIAVVLVLVISAPGF